MANCMYDGWKIFFEILLIALKIHISQATKEILDTFGTFQIELRGQVEMKVHN